MLEEGVDILECGVDIVATPPGKPSFSNSLLSGGEKALTAVALLLAIFQYRPSPFCVLDEVDAPFDEANIGRFVEVLKDFLGWTKFVIVTHSKKTMTAATTLYGVTMQESGVSKQVSVRFEDVSEDGHISAEAVRRDRISGAGRRGRTSRVIRTIGTAARGTPSRLRRADSRCTRVRSRAFPAVLRNRLLPPYVVADCPKPSPVRRVRIRRSDRYRLATIRESF